MNSKLVILANEQPLTLGDDFSISVELSNPLFNDNDIFSYPVSVPLEGNRHILKNIDDINSDLRPVSYEHTPMRIVADGVPFANGTAVMQEDEEVAGAVSMNIDASTQSFDDLIGDLKCNEIEIPSRYRDQLIIGEKIDEVNVSLTYNTRVTVKFQGKKADKVYGSAGVGNYTTKTFSPQALGFSYPAKCEETGTIHEAVQSAIHNYPTYNRIIPKIVKSYINVSEPYPIKPYCNARVCYKHYALDKDGTTSDKVVDAPLQSDKKIQFEDHGKIWALEADRPQSGICFYVLFFLDCLFEYLGVSFDKSALMKVGDFQRLCFFTTKCAYDTKPLYFQSLYEENDPQVIAGKKKKDDIKVGFFHNKITGSNISHLFDDVNKWLSSRGCGGKLYVNNPTDKSLQELTYYPVIYDVFYETLDQFPNKTAVKTKVDKVVSSQLIHVKVGENKVQSITTSSTITEAEMSASIVQMIANAKNFPDESVSTIIESLENQFGIKFHYDYEKKRVTAYLLRDVFRKQQAKPRNLHVQVHSIKQMSEKITGVRVGYSAESDSTEQKRNVKNGVKNYNTDYDYIDYPRDSTVTNEVYEEIIHEVHNTQMQTYVDMTTGNTYRVKIDADFTDGNDMRPSLFEVGAYKGVEYGDCSTINEDFIQEFISDFTPVGMVDINYENSLSASSNTVCFTDSNNQPTTPGKYQGYATKMINGSAAQNIMAAFIDEDMEHEFVKQYIKNQLSSEVADFYVQEELQLVESYDPSNTDDGNSPLQSYDWGVSIAIMRGGGADSDTESYSPDYDGFGNSKWRTTIGKYALSTDSIDCYGNVYDYNGKWEGIGNEERFSLKPRAWVQPDWADAPLVVSDPLIKDRGYFDTFLVDYAYFLLNRKKYMVRCSATVAQIADIQNHWKEWWLIDGKKCLINRVNVDITAQEGMGEVELEVFSI